jgi:MFS family permease
MPTPNDRAPSEHESLTEPPHGVPPNGNGAEDVPINDPMGVITGGPVAAWLARRTFHFTRGFQYRDFRLYMPMQFLESFGMWMRNTANAWLVYRLAGDDERMLGLFVAAVAIPTMLMLPVTGAIADRFNRKRLLGAVLLAGAASSMVIATLALTGRLAVWHLFGLALAMAVCNALRIPAKQSMLPNIVNREDLANAVALNQVLFNLSRIIAPILAGLLLAHAGAAWPYVIDAVCSCLAALMLTTLHYQGNVSRRGGEVLKAMLGGFRYLRQRGDLLTILAMLLVSTMLGQISMSMLPSLARKAFNVEATAFAVLSSTMGVGSMCGAMLLASRGRGYLSPAHAMIPITLWGAFQVALGLTPTYEAALVMIALIGVVFSLSRAMLFAGLHAATDDNVRGRIGSYFTLIVMGGAGLGSYVAGEMARWVGIRSVYIVFGGAMVLLAPLVLFAAKRLATPDSQTLTEVTR